MGENSDPQAKLLHQIDAYRRSMTLGQSLPEEGYIEATTYAKLHTMVSLLKPSENSVFANLACVDVINDFSGHIPKITEEAQTFKNYEALTQFAEMRIKLVSLFHAIAMLTGDVMPERKHGMVVFAKELRATLRDVAMQDKEHPTVYTPIQILSQLNKAITANSPLIFQVLAQCDTEGHGLAKIQKVFSQITTACTECLANNDVLLLRKIDGDDFTNIRTTISDLAFYSSFIAIRLEQQKLIEPISEILYLIDMLWTYRGAVPHLKTNPLDIARCAESAAAVFSSVSVNDMYVIFNDIKAAYSVTVANSKTTQRLVHFLCEYQDDFEIVLRQIIQSGEFAKANEAIIAFYQVFSALTLLEFDMKEASVFDPEVVIGARVQLEARMATARQLIDAQKHVPEEIVDVTQLHQLFINPNENAQGYMFSVGDLPADEILNNIVANNKEIESFQVNSPRAVAEISELKQGIVAVGYAVKQNKHPKLLELWPMLVNKWNQLIINIIDAKCVSVKNYTPRMALKETAWFAQYIIDDLRKLQKLTNGQISSAEQQIAFFTQVAQTFTELGNKFSDSLLHAQARNIQTMFQTIMGLRNELIVYDGIVMDCYLTKTFEMLLSRISVVFIYVKAFEHVICTVDDVVDSLNASDLLFRQISHECSYANQSYETIQVLRIIAHATRTLSSIRLAMLMSTPKRVQARVGELREQVETLPMILKSIGYDMSGKILEQISLAKWKLMHLAEYYEFDEAVKVCLYAANKNIRAAIEKIQDQATREMYMNMITEVQDMVNLCDSKAERTGDEPHAFSTKIKGWIGQVTVSFDPSKTGDAREELENVRIEFNNAIIAMNCRPMKLAPFVDVSSEHKGTFIEKFVGVAIQKLSNPMLFNKAVKDAELMQFPRDMNVLKKHQEVLNNIINTRDVPYEGIQEKLTLPILCYLITSKKVYYAQKDRFLACAIEFETANVDELGDMCFELSSHFHGVFEKVHPISIFLEDKMKSFLVKAYEQRSNLTLADVVYYTDKYLTVLNRKDPAAKPIFQMIIPPLKECFHVREQVYVVDCSEAIMYLNGTVPDPIRLRKIAQMVREREERKGFSVKLRPLPKQRKTSTAGRISDADVEVDDVTERHMELPDDEGEYAAEPEHSEYPKTEQQQAEQEQIEQEPEHVEPEQIEHVEQEPEHVEPEQIEQAEQEQIEQEPEHVEPEQIEQSEQEQIEQEPEHVEPEQIEQAETETETEQQAEQERQVEVEQEEQEQTGQEQEQEEQLFGQIHLDYIVSEEVLPEEIQHEQTHEDPIEPHERLPEIEVFEKGLSVEVDEEGGDVLWKSFMFATLTNTEKCQEKTLTGWSDKCFIQSDIRYPHIKMEKIDCDLDQWTPVNELNLPSSDRLLEEKNISDLQISTVMRWISNKNASVDCDVRPLAVTFKSSFKNRKVISLSESINIEGGNPHTVFTEWAEATYGTTVNPINTDMASKRDLLGGLIQVVSKFIDILTPENMDAFVDYLAFFNKEELGTLKDWIEIVFNPRRYGNNLLVRFLASVGRYIRTIINNGDEKRIQKMKKVVVYFIRIATIIVLVKAAKHGNKRVLATDSRASAVADFCEGIVSLISTAEADAETKLINLYFVEFIEVIAPISDPHCWSDLYCAYLSSMQCTSKHIKFAITSIMGLVNCPDTIVQMAVSGSYYISEALADFYIATFETNDQTIIKKCVVSFAEIVRDVECMSVNATIQTALFLLPLIRVISNVHKNNAFQDYDIVQHFVPQFMFVVHNTPKAILAEYLSGLSDDDHKSFYDAIASMFKYVLACEGLEDPFEQTTGANTREEELEILNIQNDIACSSINYVMFRELTVRTAEFIISIAKYDDFPAAVIPNAAHVLVVMLNKHLHDAHYQMVLTALSKFVFKTAHRLYSAGEQALVDFAALCMELSTRQLHVARCAGVALLIHLAYVNFTAKRTIGEFMEPVKAAYADAFSSVVPYKADVFDTLLVRYKQFFSVFVYNKFVELTENEVQMLKEMNGQIKSNKE